MNNPAYNTYTNTDWSYDGYDTYDGNINSLVAYESFPEGHVHDEMGRLLKPSHEIVSDDFIEEYDALVSKWQEQKLSSQVDWEWTSKIVWPNISGVVMLKRLDIYEQNAPKLQLATTDLAASRRIRNTPGWFPIRSVYFLDRKTSLTLNLLIETTGPPKRNKYRLEGKENTRDFSTWMPQETLNAFIGADRIPGTCDFFSDYNDLPDRYFISSDPEPPIGSRRMYRFAAYSATQYYILEKYVFSEELVSEGGFGYTYTIASGPTLSATHGWRIIGSFYGFDHQLEGSSCYTVYRRNDPFPRMIIALDTIQRAEEWDSTMKFYAFDIPVPGTVLYTLHHCLRSINSAEASIPRHRLTTEYPHHPWEFRMNIYVFPAALEDCTIERPRPRLQLKN